jgi:MFS family permease
MKAKVVAALTLFLSLSLLTAQAETIAEPAAKTPGMEIAQTISIITGVAISPLLGVSAVGAWQYFHAKTPEQKARLHWYSNPLFWIPALLLVTACFVKDTAGTALPSALKKPLDVADTIENKISGLVATGAFVPLAASIFQSQSGDGAWLSASGFAAIDLSWLYNAIMIPFSMVAFFMVFLASNAINILILLSPFTTVDAALKGFRGAVLASVAVSAWANPWIGAAWALIIIVFAYCIAGWSFRLSHFGIVFIWDFVTGRRNRFKPNNVANKVFLGRKIDKVPARTYGILCRDGQGTLIVRYHPWLVLPPRTLILPQGTFDVGRGVFYSEVLRVEGSEAKTLLLLPPRYLGHENELAQVYHFAGVRDVGLRAAWAWLTNMFNGKQVPAAA